MTQWPAPGEQEEAHRAPLRWGYPWQPDLAWSPPPPPPPPPAKRAGPGPWAFLMVLLLVVGLTVTALQLVLPPRNPAPVAPRVSVSPVKAPSVTSSPTSSAETTLMKSPLYSMKVTGGCPTIRKAASRSAYEAQVNDLLSCLGTIFRPLIEKSQGLFTKVSLTHYDKSIDTPCGRELAAFAFYCEANFTIYLSRAVYDSARLARLSVADTVIHEYGHHVQAMMGILIAADDLQEKRAVTIRREELQVFCWTYYVLVSVPSFALTDDDRTFFLDIWSQTNDPEGHGTVKAQQYWGARGFYAENLGACNTWSVPEDSVR